MQLLAKFKKILYMGIRATLNFRKFTCSSHKGQNPVQILSLKDKLSVERKKAYYNSKHNAASSIKSEQ